MRKREGEREREREDDKHWYSKGNWHEMIFFTKFYFICTVQNNEEKTGIHLIYFKKKLLF